MPRKLVPTYKIYIQHPHSLRDKYFGDLAITDAIKEIYGYTVSYKYTDAYHCITVYGVPEAPLVTPLAKTLLFLHTMWCREDRHSAGLRLHQVSYEILPCEAEAPEWVKAAIAEHDARIRKRLG